MFKYLSNIVTSRNPNLIYLQILLFLAIILLLFYVYRVTESPLKKKQKEQEGFHQEQPYVLKIDGDIYDDFFVEMYDGVNDRNKNCQKELYQIIKMTEPSKTNSVFLDVGSGTGCALNELTNAGYDAYGIDKSKAMIKYSETIYPSLSVTNGNVLDPMTYENGTFTHVLCLNFTIYEFSNKSQFFSNCYHWMKPNSYLIVHLVNPKKFSVKKYFKNQGMLTTLFDGLLPETDNVERKTNTSVDFDDCNYEEKYEFLDKNGKNDPNVIFTQVFTDKISKNIRQNEQNLAMESIDEILDLAKRAGFIVHAKTAMKALNGDENQYLYVFERTM
jgi:SAM-dependent methyltransferase